MVKPKLILKFENIVKTIETRKNSMLMCQFKKIAQESPQPSKKRKQTNSECQARRKARETHEASQSRKQANSECPGLLGFLEEPQELPISSNINKPRIYFIVYYNARTFRIILVTFYSTFCAVTHFHCVLLSI